MLVRNENLESPRVSRRELWRSCPLAERPTSLRRSERSRTLVVLAGERVPPISGRMQTELDVSCDAVDAEIDIAPLARPKRPNGASYAFRRACGEANRAVRSSAHWTTVASGAAQRSVKTGRAPSVPCRDPQRTASPPRKETETAPTDLLSSTRGGPSAFELRQMGEGSGRRPLRRARRYSAASALRGAGAAMGWQRASRCPPASTCPTRAS